VTQGEITQRLERELAGVDVLLCPTLGRARIPLGKIAGELKTEDLEVTDGELFPYSYPFNVVGWPSLSLPGGRSEADLPLGVQLSAGWGTERVLLRLAAELEEAAPWPTLPPL
jgi:Asp-tRNA(Asn)/Glu-tRNA(Gln) amidotransferase A subunit family amidase